MLDICRNRSFGEEDESNSLISKSTIDQYDELNKCDISNNTFIKFEKNADFNLDKPKAYITIGKGWS